LTHATHKYVASATSMTALLDDMNYKKYQKIIR
jgi:hypothetical protein